MKKIGTIILIAGFTIYHILQTSGVDKELADLFYWFPNMVGLSVLFFGIGHESNNKEKQLIYHPASFFWIFLAMTYMLDRIIDHEIQVNKLVLTLIIMITICLSYYFFRKRPS